MISKRASDAAQVQAADRQSVKFQSRLLWERKGKFIVEMRSIRSFPIMVPNFTIGNRLCARSLRRLLSLGNARIPRAMARCTREWPEGFSPTPEFPEVAEAKTSRRSRVANRAM